MQLTWNNVGENEGRWVGWDMLRGAVFGHTPSCWRKEGFESSLISHSRRGSLECPRVSAQGTPAALPQPQGIGVWSAQGSSSDMAQERPFFCLSAPSASESVSEAHLAECPLSPLGRSDQEFLRVQADTPHPEVKSPPANDDACREGQAGRRNGTAGGPAKRSRH